MIDALIEKKAPFVRRVFHSIIIIMNQSPLYTILNQILALSSPRAKISEQQAERIKLSGLGMPTTWSPQQFILNHPVLYSFFFLYLSWWYLNYFRRQLDGLLRMEVLTVLLNLLGVVFPCKVFFYIS